MNRSTARKEVKARMFYGLVLYRCAWNRRAWLKGAVLLALLSLLIPTSWINSPSDASEAFASPTYYTCIHTQSNCYGEYQWNGATYGAETYIGPHIFTCSPCNTSNNFHLNSTLWVHDSNTGGFIEVGYGALWETNGATWYYWANTPPQQGQMITPIAAIPSSHYDQITGFKLTRGNQGAGKVVVQIMAGDNPKYFGTVATNSMGASTFLGTDIATGMELEGIGNQTSQSSQGTVPYSFNQWQSNDFVYHYQAYGDDAHLISFDPPSSWWQTYPQNSTIGGILVVSCGC